MTWVMVVCKQSDEAEMLTILQKILGVPKAHENFFGVKRLGDLIFMVFHDPKVSSKIAEGLIVRRHMEFEQIEYLMIDRNGFL